VLRTLEAGALGAEAEALPSVQRELLADFVTGVTRVWQMTLALSLTIIMLVGMESIKLKRAEVFMVMVDAMQKRWRRLKNSFYDWIEREEQRLIFALSLDACVLILAGFSYLAKLLLADAALKVQICTIEHDRTDLSPS
jgi:hypothetical protein